MNKLTSHIKIYTSIPYTALYTTLIGTLLLTGCQEPKPSQSKSDLPQSLPSQQELSHPSTHINPNPTHTSQNTPNPPTQDKIHTSESSPEPLYTQQELEQITGEQSQEIVVEDGQTYKAQITYQPGTKIKHGKETLYYQNGAIAQISYYVNDKREGLYQIFSQKGVLIYEAHYLNGLLHGICKLFDINSGKLKGQMNFAYGLQEGEMNVYYLSGKLWYSLHYTQGKKNGIFKEFDEQGVVLRQIRYINDVQAQ